MNRLPVQSSQIRSVGYNADTATLEIEFQSGQVHEYYGVRDDHYNAFINAGSLGKHFMANIRDKHPSREIT
jgi:hypothetical protein